jgi:HEAT repeat protein
VRRAAVQALSAHKEPEALKAVADFLKDPANK